MTTTTDWKCWRDPSHEAIVDHPVFGWPQCAQCHAAPQYYERADYLPETFTLDVFVPSANRALSIFAPGSAIVGFSVDQTHVQVYYEGFIFGTPSEVKDKGPRARWVLAVKVATDRCITAYPTVATAFIRRENLIQIGVYAPKTQTLLVPDEQQLDAWIGVQHV